MSRQYDTSHRNTLPLIAGLLGLGVIALLAVAQPAAADWLVTIGGERIETDGPWQVNGNLVVFNLANGTLASLSAREVDLEASTLETRAAASQAADARATPSPKREAVLVLTDDDVGHVGPEASDAEENGEARQVTDERRKGEESARKPGNQVVVTSWDRIVNPDNSGVVVVGSIANRSKEIANGLTIEVAIYDDAGQLIAARPAVTTNAVLPPGESANFRAPFPTIFSFAEAKFQIDSYGVRLVGQPPVAEDELDEETVSF